MIRHLILVQLRKYKLKFGKTHGDLVIAGDDRKYWRREVFPHYKAGRKAARERSPFDWNVIFDGITTVRSELQEFFPYPVVCVPGAEADDVIGSLVKEFHSKESIVIVSGDKDFVQLLRFPNVSVYSPIHDELITLRGSK